MTKRVLEVDRALDVIAQHLRGSLSPGKEFSGVIAPYEGDVEVEITVRVRNRVSLTKTAKYREYAMLRWQLDRSHDHCWHSVKNRSPWSRGGTTTCSGKVTSAVVHRTHSCFVEGPMRPGEHRGLIEGRFYEFVCSHHADQNGPDVIAVVKLDKTALDHQRRKRRAHDDERQARERAEERALEAEVRALDDGALAQRLAEFVAAHQWGREDICTREQKRRAGGGRL